MTASSDLAAPNPARLNEQVQAVLRASVVSPAQSPDADTVPYGQGIQGPVWTWAVPTASVRYAPDANLAWQDPPANSFTAIVNQSGSSATAQLSMNCHVAGFWKAVPVAQATFTDGTTNWTGSGTTEVQFQVAPSGFSVVAQKTAICAGGKATTVHQTLLTATQSAADGTPQPGVLVQFSASSGTPDPPTQTTDANGRAVAVLTSAAQVGVSTVTATAGSSSATTPVAFQAPQLALATLPGIVVPGESSTLLCSVRWNGTAVPLHTVSFQITRVWDETGTPVAGTSGVFPPDYGSLSAPATADTDQTGLAAVIFQTGTSRGTVEFQAQDTTVLLTQVGSQPGLNPLSELEKIEIAKSRVLDVSVDATDTGTAKIPSVLKPWELPTLHFVTVKGTDSILLNASVTAGLDKTKLTWERGDGGVITSPAAAGMDQTTAKLSRADGGKKILVTIKNDGKVSMQVLVWIIWCDLTANIDPAKMSLIDNDKLGILSGRHKTYYQANAGIDWVATIQPPEIITDKDRPAIEQQPRQSPPGGAGNILDGGVAGVDPDNPDASGSFFTGWDMSRQKNFRTEVAAPGKAYVATTNADAVGFRPVVFPANEVLGQGLRITASP